MVIELAKESSPKFRYNIHNIQPMVRVLNQINVIHTLSPCFFTIYFHILTSTSWSCLTLFPTLLLKVCVHFSSEPCGSVSSSSKVMLLLSRVSAVFIIWQWFLSVLQINCYLSRQMNTAITCWLHIDYRRYDVFVQPAPHLAAGNRLESKLFSHLNHSNEIRTSPRPFLFGKLYSLIYWQRR
jgi:hypothetical protein